MSWAALSLKNLTNALNKVDDWQGLGIQLDIDYHDLQKIFKGHSTTEECKRTMLQFWLDSDTKASWKTLLSALHELKLNRVVEEIKSKYQIPTSTTSEAELRLVPTVTAQSENCATAGPPSTRPTDGPEETIADGVEKVQVEIATLVNQYDDLVAKAVEMFSERQEYVPNFFRKLRISVAILPTSLKYQHKYFLMHHSPQIAKATTVEEIFSILNSYCNFLNCSLLSHIISKFGDEGLQKQLNSYTTALQAFRSQTKITDFLKTCTGNSKIPPEFVALKTRMGSQWQHCTLEDAEEYRKSLAQNSSLASYALYFVEGVPGSIYLVWGVPNHAIKYIATTMNSAFLQQNCIEEVSIDGEDLEVYKCIEEIPMDSEHLEEYKHREFKMLSQPVDEVSEGLTWAIWEGCLEDVAFLFNTGVEVNRKDQYGWTALMRASCCGYIDVVQKLLIDGAQLDLQTDFGVTALMFASTYGHTHIVQELLSGGAQIDLQDEKGETALFKASRRGDPDLVQVLLSGGAQMELQNWQHWTALMQASFMEYTEVVKVLLTGGAKVDHQDELGQTVLFQASFQGHTDIVRELLSVGAQVNLQDKGGWTALIEASGSGRTDIVQELLSHGANVNLQAEDGLTALMWASSMGFNDVVQGLLFGGANVDLQNEFGWTALMEASVRGYTDIVQKLLSGGAQVDLQDENEKTALIQAIWRHHTETVKVLLAAGADVNLQEKTSGRSAVFYGAENGDLEIVKLLIQCGANISLKDKDCVTADEVAEVHGHQEVCEELRKNMDHGHLPLNMTVRDRVLATTQLLRAFFKRLDERILMPQKKQLARRTQGLRPDITLFSTHRGRV